jgi:hypothetical protein
MKIHTKFATVVAALALGAVPALALAQGQPSGTPSGPPTNQGTAHKPSTPGPSATLPAKAKAYGKYCQTESKKHVAGQHGTPFSLCVTAMAKLATGSSNNPRTACKAESKKHVAGQHGTPFSQCVSGGAKLLKTLAPSGTTTTTTTTTTTSTTDTTGTTGTTGS